MVTLLLGYVHVFINLNLGGKRIEEVRRCDCLPEVVRKVISIPKPLTKGKQYGLLVLVTRFSNTSK